MRQQCQRNINTLVRRYAEIAKASGNAEKRERMTVEGFRAVKGLTNDERRAILEEKIADGIITLVLNPEKQNPHIYGASEYNPDDHKSYFTIPFEELQKIVEERHLTGAVIITQHGQIKEIVSIPDGIARVITEDGRDLGTTNRAVIHYSRKRTHIVPTGRAEDDEN